MLFRRGGRAIAPQGEVLSPVRASHRCRVYIPGVPFEPDVVVIPAGDALLDDPPPTIHANVFATARRPLTNAAFVGATCKTER